MSAPQYELRKIISTGRIPKATIVHIGPSHDTGTLCMPQAGNVRPFRLTNAKILSRRVMCGVCFSSDRQRQRVFAETLDFDIVP